MCRIKKSVGAVLAAAGLVFAQSAPQWQNLYPEYSGLAYGAGKFVAVSVDGLVRTTGDGTGWSQVFVREGGNSRRIHSVAYGAGQFVAIQRGSSYLHSLDGAGWGVDPMNANLLWKYIAFGEPSGGWRFVAVDEEGYTAVFDKDGWGDNNDAGISLNHAAFGAGKFVAAGDGVKATNANGNWVNTSIPSSSKIAVVAFGGEKFVALSRDGGNAYTSTDGSTWTSASAGGAAAGMADMAFGNGKFVAVGAKGKGCVSGDGTSWTAFTLNEADDFKAVKFGGNAFLALGAKGSVYKSSDGSKWDRLAGNSVTSYKQIVFGGGKFVAVGDSGVSVSANGKDWERKTGAKNLTGVTYGANRFVAVGDSGVVISSADGNTWTDHSQNTGGELFTSVAFGGTTFIAGGRTQGVAAQSKVVVYTSTDGQAWTNYESNDLSGGWSQGQYIASLCFGNEKFIAAVMGVGATKTLRECGATGREVGKYWSNVSDLPGEADGYLLGSAVYTDNKFVVLGTKITGEAVVLNSADAVSWQAFPISSEEIKWVRSATYAKGANIIVADSGNIYAYLENRWIQQGKATNRHLSTIYSGNNVILAAGVNGAMLYSEAPPTSIRHTPAPRGAASSKGVMSLERSRRAPAVTLSFTPNGAGTIAVYSLSGKRLYKARLSAGERSVRLPERIMSSGSLIVRYSGDGRVLNQRFQFVR